MPHQRKTTRPTDRGDAMAAFGGSVDRAPEILMRVVKLAWCYRARFIAASAANVAASLCNLAIPILLGTAVDRVVAMMRHATPGTPAGLIVPSLSLLAISTARGGLQMASAYNGEWIGQNVAHDLRLRYFDAIQRLGFPFHDAVDPGELITRGMLDLEGVRGFIEIGLQRILQLILLFGFGLVALIGTDPIMAIVTLSFVPVAAWRAGTMGLRLRVAWTRLQQYMAVLTRVAEENLHGARVVRAFAARDHELARYDDAAADALLLSNQRIVVRSRGMATINSAYYGAMLLVVAVGAARVHAGAISVGELTRCLAFMTILQLPVRQTSMIMNSAARAVSSGARVFDILDAGRRVADRPGAKPLRVTEGRLRLEEVSFGYGPSDERPTIRDISFSVGPGETIGIVGPTGSGKSTIAALIPRFYDVSAGRITIDGQDIRDVTLQSLRGAVQLVQQDVFLFDDTAAHNIGYAAPGAEDAALRQAAAIAQIDGHIAGLPDGYETAMGERGVNLSGGQRQRMTIARGLLPRPAILVLDDVTSALDASTERRFREALDGASDRHATIIISHRLTSLHHADEILVIADGRVAERGTHASLLAAGGAYAALHRLQTDRAIETQVAA